MILNVQWSSFIINNKARSISIEVVLQNTHFSMDRGQVAEMEGDSLPKAFLFGNLVSGRLIRENIKK